MPPVLELRDIVKRFPGVVANDRVSLSVERGEIRALVGENGAGKTTLMNILYGLTQPDDGRIFVDAKACRFHSPLDAIRAGLGMVHQHFMLFPSLSAAENVVFGAEPHRFGRVDRKSAERSVAELAERFGLKVDSQAKVARLPVGVRQRIEILKMLYRGAEILILDEPTAVLAPQERQALFNVLRALSTEGKTVIFITHKLSEVLEISDRATVLRDGAVTGTVVSAETSAEELCRLMVGREVELRFERGAAEPRHKVLEVRGLSVPGSRGGLAVRDVDLEVRAGEIVGVAGAAGNGQMELIEAIAGLRATTGGRILLEGIDVTDADVPQRRIHQSHVPEDRDGVGLALEASVADNLLLGFEREPGFSRWGVLSMRTVREHADTLRDRYSVKSSSTAEPAHNLSGGNRQKLVLGRELAHGRPLLIAEQPTRGVDIGATEQVYKLLLDYRERGHAVLLVSTDLVEILALSDRIIVMFEGGIAGAMPSAEATEGRLGMLMTGGGSKRGAAG